VRQRWPSFVLLPLVLLATACADAPAEATAPFEPASRAVETEAGVLVVHFDSVAPSLSRGVRLDAETLDTLPGEVPMHFGGPLDSAGRYIATFEPSGWAERARVLVYDLETWELAWSLDDLPSGRLQWHGSSLYLWGDHCDGEPLLGGGGCEAAWERGVWRLTPEGAERIVSFDFSVGEGHPLIGAGAHRGYAIGVETDFCCGIQPQGEPFLAILGLVSGEVEARIPLPRLLIGQPGDWLGSRDHHFGGRYIPGLAISADETRAYVVHAEQDRVTVVDLDRLKVDATHSLEGDPPLARFRGWLLDRFARVAEAKMAAEYLRQVQLTPDGRYLLISGVSVEETPDEVGPRELVETKVAGLLVVDVATMDVVYRSETISAFTLSPNGYSVLAWGGGYRGSQPSGVTVLDLRTMAALHVLPEHQLHGVFASPDGLRGYVHVPFKLIAIDLETGRVLAEGQLEQRGNMGWDRPTGLDFSP
jgi:hypothetical protein